MDRVVVDRLSAARADSEDEDVVVAGGAMTLPEGAEQNADGSVTLTLAYPITLRTRIAGSDVVHEEPITELVLHRLSGADMRRIMATRKAMGAMALARSSRLTPARMALIAARMDASDVSAANAVVAEIAGFDALDGLPEHAVDSGDTITLPLRFPCDLDGGLADELTFHRLTGADLVVIQQARDTLPAALARSTRMSPKDADALFDAMDAADVMAANGVIGFLLGSGRKTGR